MTPEVRKINEAPASTSAPAGKPPSADKTVPAGQTPPAKKNAAGPKPGAGSKRTWKSKALVGVVAAVVLFGGGMFLGTTLPDPSKSEQYVALQEGKAGVDGKLELLQGDYATLEGIYLKLKDGTAARDDKATARESAVAAAEKKVAEAEAAVKRREEAVTGAEAVKAKNTFGDGTRTVGRDIEPGTYIPTADVGSSCYWGIYATGTNGSDIVDNDIPGGGRPSVTLSEGQDFKSSRCGSWTKQ